MKSSGGIAAGGARVGGTVLAAETVLPALVGG